MPPGGFADPITGDGTRFYSNMHASELAKHVTRAIKAGGINSTPLVAKTEDQVTRKTRPTPIRP